MAGLKKKKPDANFIHWDFLDLNEEKLEESLNTVGGLFESKNIYLFSNIFQKVKIKNIFLERIDEFASSENAFILTLDKVGAAEKKILREKSYLFEEFNLDKKEFNPFSLSDELQNKNKKALWLKYHQALNSDLPAERIFSTLFFSLKSLILAEKFSEKESGLKAYPYKKAISALKNKWKAGEAEEKTFQLVSLYNQSRQSGLNLKDSLEKFILEL